MTIQQNSTKKIAIFVEGMTEFIFVSHFLKTITEYKVNIEALELHKDQLRKSIVGGIDFNNPISTIQFLIIKVGNDEKVLSAISERARGLKDKGYNNILGLRDMYSEAYKKKSPGQVNSAITNSFIDIAKETIEDMGFTSLQIDIFFSIMEIEAWFLATWEIFEAINPTHTKGYIENTLGIDLNNLEKYFRPFLEIKKIILVYNKKERQVKDIVSRINKALIDNVINENRCPAYSDFICKIQNLIAYQRHDN